MNRSEAGKLGAIKSRPTQITTHLEFVENYYKTPKHCKYCNNILVFEKRRNNFCDQSCAARYNNEIRCGNGIKISLYKNCGNEVSSGKIYCSHKCHNKYKRNLFINEWINNDKSVSTCNGMSVSFHVKNWLREQNGDKCGICGWCEKNVVTGKVPLQLDHKDGNSENNSPENLRFICPNCHSLTPTFGSLNRGKGRKLRYVSKV